MDEPEIPAAAGPSPSTTGLAGRIEGLKAEVNQARAAVALAFVAGLLVGWVVLGWWLFPVDWTNTLPADLAPEYQATYVQLVADAYVRDGDLAAAQAALAGFDAESLTTTLATLGTNTADPVAAQNARSLAGALVAGVATAPTAAAQSGTPTEGGTDLVTLTRSLAWVVLVAALGAGLALAGAWLWLRRKSQAGERGGVVGSDGGSGSAGTSSAAVAAGLAVASAGPPGSAGPPPGTGAAFGADAEGTGAPVAWAKPSTGPRRVVPAAPAGEGQSERIKLGQTVRARYQANQSPPRQSWLIHDERGELIGGAGWQAHRVGNVTTVDFRVSDRDDLDQTTRTPIVRFVAPAAYSDAILHGRLSGPQLVPAVPGESVSLRTVDLILDVAVEAAEPAPDSEGTSLTALTLAFTPRGNPPDTASLFQMDADVVWEDEEPEDEIDDAFGPKPPAPLKFRRD